jgi:plastocyanin
MGIRRLPTVAGSLLIAAVVVAVPAAARADSVPRTVRIRFGTDCASGGFCFEPPTLTIADGDKVTWEDDSPEMHTVTRCTPAVCNGIDGGTGTDASFTGGSVIPPGYYNPPGSYSHVFHGAGTYNYYCTIHGFSAMHGTVTVMATAPPTTPYTTTTIAATATTASATATPATMAPATAAPATLSAQAGTPTTVTGPVLARTGSTQLPILFASIALIGVGGLFTLAGRRRRDSKQRPSGNG